MKDQPEDTLPVRKDESPSIRHKTLEERAAEYGGRLNPDGEPDRRGDPVGNEVW